MDEACKEGNLFVTTTGCSDIIMGRCVSWQHRIMCTAVLNQNCGLTCSPHRFIDNLTLSRVFCPFVFLT